MVIFLLCSVTLSLSIAIPKVQLRLKFGYVHTKKYKFTRIITIFYNDIKKDLEIERYLHQTATFLQRAFEPF